MPVYNSSQFLDIALRSVLLQSFKDFELIVINDGSKDNSAEICKQFAEIDNRIVFIDKVNEGVAISRNRCLDIARGKYIIFVDSDDILYSGALEIIYREIGALKPDLIRYEYQYIDEKGSDLYPNYKKIDRKKYQGVILDSASFMSRIMMNEYFLCMHCFKKDMIAKTLLRFKEGCTFNEDTLFICRFLTYSKRNLYISDKVYGYRKTSSAVTMNFTKKNASDILGVFCDLYKLADTCGQPLSKNIKKVAQYLLLNLYEHRNLLNEQGFYDAIKVCVQTPYIGEWTIFRYMHRYSKIVWLILNVKRKIIRKIKFTLYG